MSAVPEKQAYDVIVIGGGPAGATAAALIAEQKKDVLLLEREKSPKFKIGESLMPATYWTFKRLGILDKMKESSFTKKYSVQFVSKSGKSSAPFYFFENNDHESSRTWQVDRDHFDELLLDTAAQKGAEVYFGGQVLDVLFDGEKAVGVRTKLQDKSIKNINSKVVVDASGQSALLSRKLGISAPEPDLKKIAIYTHYKGGARDHGVDEGATIIYKTSHGDSWFWYIPLQDDILSVGVVGSVDRLVKKRKEALQTIFDMELEQCPALKERLVNAEMLYPVKTVKDFSYRAAKIAGDGWVLVGDAFGFLDPMYSSGVFLALKMGEFAADAIVEALDKNDLTGKQLGKFQARITQGMHWIRGLINAFYTEDFSFGKFLGQNPEFKQPVVDILTGDVIDKDMQRLLDAMAEIVDPADGNGTPA
jgi:flavin-dependent dehydrogenase